MKEGKNSLLKSRQRILDTEFFLITDLREEIQKPICKEAHLKYITEAIYF
jgi:hypothetical protein